jgi:superfamily II DNA or RNA helicase
MKSTEKASAKRGELAKLRIDLGKQISKVPPANIFKAGDFSLVPPALWDQAGELRFMPLALWNQTAELEVEEIAIQSEVARIPSPLYAEVSITIVLQVYGGVKETCFPDEDTVTVLWPHYNESTPIIPLQASVNTVELNPAENIGFASLDLSLDLLTIDSLELGIDPNVTIIARSFAAITSEKIHIYGMNYADRHWHLISIHVDNNAPQGNAEKAERRRDGDFVKRKARGRKPKHRQPLPSIWDLLFALLQPPLHFGQSENYLFPSEPFGYQWQGIKFLLDNEHALLADDMGTGKTVMTIVALKFLIHQAKIHHVLILCPPSVLYEWQRHLNDWAPELTTYFIRSSQKEVRKSLWQTPMHIAVTSYGTLRSDIESRVLSKESIERFDVVVLDEAHHIKNIKSKRFRAIKQLQPKRRWALTGTPIQNKIDDLASIFEFVYPGYLTPYDLHVERIQEKIRPYYLRRRKQDVMPELPSKIYEPIELELDEEQEKAYRLAEAGIREEFDEVLARGERVTKQHIFARLTKLKQICNFAPRKQSSPKTDSLRARIEEIIESGAQETIASGNKVIVFSQFVDEGVSKLEKLLQPYGVAKIVGNQTDATRRGEIEKFKKRKDIPILIASVRSGGEGLNLTEASYVVHFDHWWNPAVMWQAEDRVHRRGQARGVNIYSYWMKNTIDDRIREKLREKGILFDKVVDGLAAEGIDELFTIDEWLEMFGVQNVKVERKLVLDVTPWQSMGLSEIREKLYEIKPSEFEELVRELMHFLGYPNVKVTGKSHDGGIDVLSTRNTPHGIERVAAQCKRYRGNVPVHTARDFFGAIANDKSIKQGFLVTTGEFTAECLRFCESNGMIRAISGIELAKYVQQFGLHT